jgi:pyrroline-5-carboxylate reductase
MRIGIIGIGHIGGTLAHHLVRVGHEVAISNSRGPDTPEDVVAELGPNARAMTAEEAAAFGDLVVVYDVGPLNERNAPARQARDRDWRASRGSRPLARPSRACRERDPR